MRKIAVWILAFGLMASPVLANGASGDGTDSAKPANGSAADAAKQPAAPAKSADKAKAKPSLEEELDEMRGALRSQADQITRQQEEIDVMKTQLATEAAAPNGVALASFAACVRWRSAATLTAGPAASTAASTSSVASAANVPFGLGRFIYGFVNSHADGPQLLPIVLRSRTRNRHRSSSGSVRPGSHPAASWI